MKAAAPINDLQKAEKLLKAYHSDEEVKGNIVDSDEEEENPTL